MHQFGHLSLHQESARNGKFEKGKRGIQMTDSMDIAKSGQYSSRYTFNEKGLRKDSNFE